MHVVQVCNVGNICGGTAACAWTVTRALPQCRHTVLFLSAITDETRVAFQHCQIESHRCVDDALVSRLQPNLVILHNTSPERCDRVFAAMSIQYQHSIGQRTAADLTVYCSRWLAASMKMDGPVLYQAIPIPPGGQGTFLHNRRFDDEVIVGRICTPAAHKWPRQLIPFYDTLSRMFPRIRWEFVGAPESLQEALTTACRGRALFHPAGWQARSHLWRWHALLYHHPTLTETFGRTAAEAMRAGCIPIVDHRGGFAEQISSGQNGFLANDLSGFVEAIEAVEQPHRRWEIAHHARDHADQHFSLRQFAKSLRELLTRLAAN